MTKKRNKLLVGVSILQAVALVSLLLLGASCSDGVTNDITPNCEIQSGEIIVSEMYLNTSEKSFWIELYNQSKRTIQLNKAFISISGNNYLIQNELQMPESTWLVIGNKNAWQADHVINNFKPQNEIGNLTVQCKNTSIDDIQYNISGINNASIAMDPILTDSEIGIRNTESWCIDTITSPGYENPLCGFNNCTIQASGQTKATKHALPGELLISEIFVNPQNSVEKTQWIELTANPASELDLNGIVLEQSAGEKRNIRWQLSSPYCITADSAYSVVTIGSTESSVEKLASLAGAKLVNHNSTLRLLFNGIELDRVEIPTAVSETSLKRESGIESDKLTQCNGQYLIGDAHKTSTPGEDNGQCIESCIEGDSVRPVLSPRQGELVINEVYSLPEDGTPRWIEIKNQSTHNIDLNGMHIIHKNISTKQNRKWTLFSNNCITIETEDFGIISEAQQYEESFLSLYTFKEFKLVSEVETELVLYFDGIIDHANLPIAEFGYSTQLSAELESPELDNNLITNWCYSSADHIASPGRVNAHCQ